MEYEIDPLQRVIVSLDQIEERFEAGQTVNGESLAEVGVVKYEARPIKLLGRGELSKQLTIEVDRASQTAVNLSEW